MDTIFEAKLKWEFTDLTWEEVNVVRESFLKNSKPYHFDYSMKTDNYGNYTFTFSTGGIKMYEIGNKILNDILYDIS